MSDLDPTPGPVCQAEPQLSVRTVMTIVAVAGVALAGFGGFRLAAGLDLGAEAGAGMVALAALNGFAVFFSTCSFPLLLAGF